MENKSIFETLNKIDVKDKIEKKNGLAYLSWAWAWAELKKFYPESKYSIKYFDNKPYMYDENLGYMVSTEMTINNITHEMWLPVMDGANKAMKDKSYEYTTKFGKKTCEPATMFDINKTIMRCLVKNIAMFGLGLYIYAGEDLPENETDIEPIKKQEFVAEEVLEKNIEGIIERCEAKIASTGTPYFRVKVQGEIFSVYNQKDLKEGLKIKTKLVKNGKFWNSRDFEVIENIIKDTPEDLDLEIPF